MPPTTSPLRLTVSGTAEPLEFTPKRLIVAGYTGRDADAVAEHIAELADIGVPPPATVPAFYDLDPALLTTDTVVDVGSPDTSGEVEPVIIRHGGRHYLGVGSDHTDRELEKTDITGSKAACPKPIGQAVVPLPDDLAELDFDAILATSEVDGEAYQRGALAALRTPADVLARLAAVLPDTAGDVVVFGGTLPLLTGRFVFGRGWKLQLEFGDGTVLTHTYETNAATSPSTGSSDAASVLRHPRPRPADEGPLATEPVGDTTADEGLVEHAGEMVSKAATEIGAALPR